MFLSRWLMCCLVGLCTIAAVGEMPEKPNIIFIIVDDMGYADLGCYGGEVLSTPNIDQMAAEGIRFTDAYSGSTVCAPARSTLLTGQHMGHTSVRGNTGGISLQAEDVTLGEVMKAAGYATGGFGKWGVGDLGTDGVPEKKGFDLFYGYYHQIHAHSYFPDYLIRNGKKEMLPGNRGKRGPHYTHYLIMEEMKQFIRDHAEEPFFCYAPWTPPHGDYVMPPEDPAWKKYKDRDGWNRTEKAAAAMMEMVDRNVGEVIALLKELGIDEKTIVFFCSDNGAAYRFEGSMDSSGPLLGYKRSMHEGGIRVPMVVRWTGQVAPGQESDLQWYFPDVLPRLATLGGAVGAIPSEVDGISIVPTLLGKGTQEQHEALYWEWPTYNWAERVYPENGLMQAVRMGKWKLLRHKADEPWELYDLSQDIGEEHNLARQYPEQVARMVAWIAENRVAPVAQIEPKMPEGQRYR